MNKEDFFSWFNGMMNFPQDIKRQITEAYIEGRIDKETYIKRMSEVDRTAD